jgi:hypothetical protein
MTRVPSWHVEGLYYFVITYSLVAGYLGIEVPLVAAALTMALMAFCYTTVGSHSTRPIAALLGCAASFVIVQFVVHQIPPLDPLIRSLIVWACGMIVVQSLCFRHGFVQRCTVVIFVLGLIAVPSLRYVDAGSAERAAAGIQLGGNLRNANGLGSWFGFCFVALALLGLETQRLALRTVFWSAAMASLLIVGLTVSRGAVIGSAVAVAVGFRSILKRGFVPVLVLLIFTGVVLETELFDQVVARYEARGLEDTGRAVLWPNVVPRVLASPLAGVGIDNIETYIPQTGRSISTPHNAFLFFALSSGVIPFSFWLLFWLSRGRRLMFRKATGPLASFQLPFFLYTLIQFLLGDLNNDPWGLLAIAVTAAPGFSDAGRRFASGLTSGPRHKRGAIAGAVHGGTMTSPN